MKREEQAASIMFEVGRFDDAINICLKAKKVRLLAISNLLSKTFTLLFCLHFIFIVIFFYFFIFVALLINYDY